MIGLRRLTNAVQREQAWADWRALASAAVERGMGDLVEVCTPREGAGWREVDREIAKLRKLMQERDYEVYTI